MNVGDWMTSVQVLVSASLSSCYVLLRIQSSSRDYLISESPVVGIDWALGGFTLNTFVTACCERRDRKSVV